MRDSGWTQKRANQAGVKIDTQGFESLQHEIRTLRGKLGEAADDVTNLSARLRDEGAVVAPLRDRLVAATELAVRVLATLEVMQSGLQRLDEKITRPATRSHAGQLQDALHSQ